MHHNSYKKAAFAAVLMSGTALTSPNIAAAAVDELLVTATRRATSVQDVPYNISAFSAEQLDRAGITDISNFARIVPGLAYVDSGPRVASNNSGLILRGLNATEATAFDIVNTAVPPVSTYVGETPVYFNLKLIDLERVEVLRGPQGTLYGSGSLGGTIRFIPKAPDPSAMYTEMSAEISVTEHSDELNHEISGVVNIPLGERAALRVSGGYEHLGGFIDATNLATFDAGGVPIIDGPILDPATSLVTRSKEDINDSDISFIRAALKADITDNVSAQLSYNFQRAEADGRQAHNPDFTGKDYENSMHFDEPLSVDVNLVSFDVEADLGFATLTSSSSYYDIDLEARGDNSGFYAEVFPAYYFGYTRWVLPAETFMEEEAFTQEFRLTSNSDGPVDWMIGAYYNDQDRSYLGINPEDRGLAAYTAAVDPLMAYYAVPTPDVSNVHLFENGIVTNFKDKAIFGELTWNITDRWQVTGGMRAFWQDFDSEIDVALPFCFAIWDTIGAGGICGDPPDGRVVVPSSSSTEDQIFKFNTSYAVNDDTNVYFTWAEGFRHGGVNGLPTSGLFAEPTSFLNYDADTATNWEIGVKGSLADGNANYTVAAFYIDWEDMQFDGFTPTGFNAVFTGSKAISQGIEAELGGQLGDNVIYNLGYTYTDATIDEDFITGGAVGFKGDSLPGVPEHSVSASFDISQPLSNGVELVYHIDGSYRSDTVTSFNALNRRYQEFDGFTIVNAALSLNTEENWSVRLFANNIFSEEGTTGGYNSAGLGDFGAYKQVARPRTIGLRVTFQN